MTGWNATRSNWHKAVGICLLAIKSGINEALMNLRFVEQRRSFSKELQRTWNLSANGVTARRKLTSFPDSEKARRIVELKHLSLRFV